MINCRRIIDVSNCHRILDVANSILDETENSALSVEALVALPRNPAVELGEVGLLDPDSEALCWFFLMPSHVILN